MWPSIPPRNGEGDHAEHGGGVGAEEVVGSNANRLVLRLLPLHHPSGGPPPHLQMGRDWGQSSRHMMLWERGVQRPVFTPAWRSALPVQLLQVKRAL